MKYFEITAQVVIDGKEPKQFNILSKYTYDENIAKRTITGKCRELNPDAKNVEIINISVIEKQADVIDLAAHNFITMTS